MTEVFGQGSPEWNEALAARVASTAAAEPCRRPTSSASRSTVAAAGERSARRTRTRSPTCCPTSRAATRASTRSTAPSTSTRRSPTATCVNDTGRAPRSPIRRGNCGFPGFDGMLAKNTLGYVEQMQENGVPGHLRLHLRRARLPHAEPRDRRVLEHRARARRGCARGAAEGLRRRVRRRSSRTWRRTASTRATRCSRHRRRGRPLRRRRRHAAGGRQPRVRAHELHRPDGLPGEPDRRGQRRTSSSATRPQPTSPSTATTPRPSTSTATRRRTDPTVRIARAQPGDPDRSPTRT